MVLAALFPITTRTHSLAASVLGEWLLWGGLAALFTVLYIGVYIWMRRPKFGEGPTPGRPDAAAPSGDAAAGDASGTPGAARDDEAAGGS